jgi:PAS domain S-box-containing protein
VNALARKRADEALRDSEERLNLSADAAETGLWSLDLSTNIFWVNDRIRKIFGFAQDDVITMDRVLRAIHPDDRDLVKKAIEHSLESGVTSKADYRILMADGTVKWLVSRGRAFINASGAPERLMGVTLDMTRRKQEEESRLESMERYHAIVDAYDGYIYICSQDYRVEYMNQRMIERTGRNAVGERCYEALHGRDSVCPWCVNDRVFRGETVRWELQSPLDHRWYYAVNAPIRHTDGTISKQSMIEDITERKLAEQALSESQARMSAIVENTGDMIWSVDTKRFGLLTFNSALRKYFLEGRGLEIREGMAPEDMLPPDYAGQWHEFYDRALREGSFVTEYLTSAKTHVLLLSINLLKRNGQVFGISVSGKDITERKRAEEELKKSYAEITRLKDKLEEENRYLRDEVSLSLDNKEIIGRSDAIKYVQYRISQVASLDTTVLIVGETGTGKGLVARAVHEASQRRDSPMIHVNCAVLPANLIESELFGREKGAFTGAQAKQIGRFELAHKGTLFLDEIAELPIELQAKLLRVVESGEFERLGDPRTVKVDVRIIASTNRNLEEEIRKGRFREDLYYRLNVFPITVPALRQRSEDIPLIVDVLITRLNKQMGRHITTVPRDVMEILQQYTWPGNVRELENVIERAVIMSRGPVLQLAEQLGASTQPMMEVQETKLAGLADVERAHIRKTLEALKWKIEGPKGAAHALGMKPSTLRDRMQKLDIRRPGHS